MTPLMQLDPAQTLQPGNLAHLLVRLVEVVLLAVLALHLVADRSSPR
jgi:hypothetical protein